MFAKEAARLGLSVLVLEAGGHHLPGPDDAARATCCQLFLRRGRTLHGRWRGDDHRQRDRRLDGSNTNSLCKRALQWVLSRWVHRLQLRRLEPVRAIHRLCRRRRASRHAAWRNGRQPETTRSCAAASGGSAGKQQLASSQPPKAVSARAFASWAAPPQRQGKRRQIVIPARSSWAPTSSAMRALSRSFTTESASKGVVAATLKQEVSSAQRPAVGPAVCVAGVR